MSMNYEYKIGDILIWFPKNREFPAIRVVVEDFSYDTINQEYYKVSDFETGKLLYGAYQRDLFAHSSLEQVVNSIKFRRKYYNASFSSN